MANNDYSTFECYKNMYPIVKKTMSTNRNAEKLVSYISRYIDKNHNILFNKGLYALYWNTGDESDTKIIYTSIGCNENFIKKIIADSKQNKSNWILYNKPYFWAMVSCIKYFMDNKKEKELEMIILYLSFAMYATIHYKYFRGYPPNENAMDYTINNLSNRFDLKKVGSLIKALQKVAMVSHDTYKDFFIDKNFCDRRVVEYIMNLYTRINNFVKNIKNEYQKVKESGKYLNYDEENLSAENFHENDNVSFQIERYSNKITNRIMTSGTNNKLCDTAAKLAGVSMNSVREVVNKVIDQNTDEVKEFITLFLQQYLIVDNHPVETISSSNYITYASKIYSKSNTTDKGVIRIKELLDKWLRENSKKYVQTQRQATLINYRKSIFLYFALAVQAVINNNY